MLGTSSIWEKWQTIDAMIVQILRGLAPPQLPMSQVAQQLKQMNAPDPGEAFYDLEHYIEATAGNLWEVQFADGARWCVLIEKDKKR